MTTEPQPNPNPSLNSKLDPHSGPASQGVVFGEHAEGLRFWMLARGIEASPEYIRHLWRKVSNQVEVDTLMLAARQAPELPTLPPDAPQADGPVR